MFDLSADFLENLLASKHWNGVKKRNLPKEQCSSIMIIQVKPFRFIFHPSICALTSKYTHRYICNSPLLDIGQIPAEDLIQYLVMLEQNIKYKFTHCQLRHYTLFLRTCSQPSVHFLKMNKITYQIIIKQRYLLFLAHLHFMSNLYELFVTLLLFTN